MTKYLERKMEVIMKREKNHWLFYILLCLFVISISLYYSPKAHATIYFSETSESRTCDSAVPWYWENTQGFYRCDGDAYAGSKYLKWHVGTNGLSAYTGIDLTGISGNRTYYLAFYFKIQRVGGINVHENTSDTSADKFIEYTGSPGIRYVIEIGKLESECFVLNQTGRFTTWVYSEPDLNPLLRCRGMYVQNANGYSGSNPYQITYDAWHSGVLEVKMASNNTGYIRQYLDGVKILEYMNIQTMESEGTAQIGAIKLNGTIAQPAYNSPEHYRMFDNIIFTDNWQDIIDGSYLQAPGTSDTTPPAAPTGVAVQ
jgi:hypothetical protein